jgi:stage III sporulation protein AG
MENSNVKNGEAAPTVKEKAGSLIASFKKLDTKKKIQYVAVLLLAIIILTIYFSSFKSSAPDTAAPETSKAAVGYDDLEERLEKILSKIEGAGKVDVMITYESTPEKVPALSVDKQTSTSTDIGENGTNTTNIENTQSDVVTVNGGNGNDAFILRENTPKIMGVIVIAEGADNITVKLDLLRAVETVLNVSPDRVDVYKMNNE